MDLVQYAFGLKREVVKPPLVSLPYALKSVPLLQVQFDKQTRSFKMGKRPSWLSLDQELFAKFVDFYI